MLVDEAHAGLGTALAEAAGPSRQWLGLGYVDPGPLLLVVVGDTLGFNAWSQGRVPSWGAGLTFPGSRLIVVRADAGDPFGILRHELAHVALHRRIKGRVPLWFDEGYAVMAAQEYGRLADLRLNVTVAAGKVPDLRGLDGALRGTRGDAEAAYALAGSAVAELARRNPSGSLGPLLGRLVNGEPFEDAVLATTGLTAERFDEAWHRRVRQHYNWLVWLATGGAWLIVTLLLGWAAAWRRHRDAPRRAALDIGWTVPEDDGHITTPEQPHFQLDRPDSGG